jgi:hypothetical protein
MFFTSPVMRLSWRKLNSEPVEIDCEDFGTSFFHLEKVGLERDIAEHRE